MSNSVQAAGEAMPGNLITVLYGQWKGHFEVASTPGPSEIADAAAENLRMTKEAILALPTVTLHDFAAKIAVSAADGDNQIDTVLINEARELADTRPKTSMKAISGCLADVEDQLATARYFSRAVSMAASGLSDRDQMNVFQMLAEKIEAILKDVRDELDEVRDEL